MKWARIQDSSVVNVIEQETTPGAQWVNVTGLTVGPGFRVDGENFAPPKSVLAVVEFLARLTLDEEASIARASADTPAGNPAARLTQARIRALLRRLHAKQAVSLDDADVSVFLNAAEAAGVLTPARVAELLS